MSIFIAICIAILFVLILVALIYNMGTGRGLIEDLIEARFTYQLHRRQCMRSRRDALRETIKEILK